MTFIGSLRTFVPGKNPQIYCKLLTTYITLTGTDFIDIHFKWFVWLCKLKSNYNLIEGIYFILLNEWNITQHFTWCILGDTTLHFAFRKHHIDIYCENEYRSYCQKIYNFYKERILNL